MTYLYTLTLHSWLRWLVLALGLVAFIRALTAGRRPWGPADDRSALWFTIVLDIQVLIGLVLYLMLSPITHEAMGNFGAAMKSPTLRFWAVEHGFGILIGVALAHIGRGRIRKADPARRHKIAAIFFGLALLAILVSLPWPGTPNARPLVRW